MLGLLALLLGTGALLVFMAPGASGPSLIPLHPDRGDTATAAESATAEPTAYGSKAAAPAQRVRPRFKLPLRSGVLFDISTGRVLWARAARTPLPIASLTKMMTALVVVAHARPGEQVMITPAAVHYTGSGIGLLPVRRRVSLQALLYGLLLPSGNDAAIALAQHVAGTRPRFIAMMNARARELGLQCTHFNSVSGIVDQDNYSCASDLAVLAHAILEQPLLARIVSSRSAVLPFPIKGGKLFLFNNNPLLISRYPGIDGVKTGYTNASGRCLVASARRGRRWVGVVLLHSADPADQAQQLLNAGFRKLAGR